MVRDPLGGEEDPGRGTGLGALYDEDCRTIVGELEEPLTTRDLVERRDVPRSTLSRKLDRLTAATLLYESTGIREDGSHGGNSAEAHRFSGARKRVPPSYAASSSGSASASRASPSSRGSR